MCDIHYTHRYDMVSHMDCNCVSRGVRDRNEIHKKMKYTVELNRRQIGLLATVLEQHTRIMCGHWNTSTIPAIDRALEKHTDSFDEYILKRSDVETKLDEIKKIVFPELGNGNYGIGHDDESDACYEMYKMILLQFDKERRGKEGYYENVHSHEPLHYSKEPFICVKQHKE